MQPHSEEKIMPDSTPMALGSTHPYKVNTRTSVPLVRRPAPVWTFDDLKNGKSHTSTKRLVLKQRVRLEERCADFL